MKEGDAVYPIHEQQTIYVRNSEGKRKRIVCDKGIVPLIRNLWANGYETLFSCEGHDRNYPYVVIKNVGSNPKKVHAILKSFWNCPIWTHGGNAFYALKSAEHKRRFEMSRKIPMDMFI